MKSISIALLLTFATLLPANALAHWASIAYSKTTGNVGYTNAWPDERSAEEDAIKQCKADDCLVVASHAEACLALSVGDHIDHYGWAWNTNQVNAEHRSIVYCAKNDTHCAVKVSVCSEP